MCADVDPCPADAANDGDGDGHCADVDNCPACSTRPERRDTDGTGDVCDACPADPANDADADRVCGNVDDCPVTFNPLQGDTDSDGRGNLCDVCPGIADPLQADADGDGAGDACDGQPIDPNRSRPRRGRAPRGRTLGHDGHAELGSRDRRRLLRHVARVLSQRGPDSTAPASCKRSSPPKSATRRCRRRGGLLLSRARTKRRSRSRPARLDLLRTPARQHESRKLRGSRGRRCAPIRAGWGGGTVSGTLAALASSDNQYQSITWNGSPAGPPAERYSWLEHRWTFNVPAGGRKELHVEGFHSTSLDNDGFSFEWSADGTNFTFALVGIPGQRRWDRSDGAAPSNCPAR
jgi:hypothetical protein